MSVSALNFLESCKPSWPLKCEVMIHSPLWCQKCKILLQFLKRRILSVAKFVWEGVRDLLEDQDVGLDSLTFHVLYHSGKTI